MFDIVHVLSVFFYVFQWVSIFVVFTMFSNGFEVLYKIYLGFSRFYTKVSKHTKTHFWALAARLGAQVRLPLPLSPSWPQSIPWKEKRSQELLALADTIKLLNDDDALVLVFSFFTWMVRSNSPSPFPASLERALCPEIGTRDYPISGRRDYPISGNLDNPTFRNCDYPILGPRDYPILGTVIIQYGEIVTVQYWDHVIIQYWENGII